MVQRALIGKQGGSIIGGIEVDIITEEAHTFENNVTSVPIETGEQIQEHVIIVPESPEIKFRVSNLDGGDNATQVFQNFVTLRNSRDLVEVMTKHYLYQNMVIESFAANNIAPFDGVLEGTIKFKIVNTAGKAGTSSRGKESNLASSTDLNLFPPIAKTASKLIDLGNRDGLAINTIQRIINSLESVVTSYGIDGLSTILPSNIVEQGANKYIKDTSQTVTPVYNNSIYTGTSGEVIKYNKNNESNEITTITTELPIKIDEAKIDTSFFPSTKIIPNTNDGSSSIKMFAISNNDQSLLFVTHYNYSSNHWYLDIFDNENTLIIAGILIMPFYNLIREYTDKKSVLGYDIHAIDTTRNDITGENSLGVTGFVSKWKSSEFVVIDGTYQLSTSDFDKTFPEKPIERELSFSIVNVGIAI